MNQARIYTNDKPENPIIMPDLVYIISDIREEVQPDENGGGEITTMWSYVLEEAITPQEYIKRQQGVIEYLTKISGIVFVLSAESGGVDDVTIAENTSLFAEWGIGISYVVGNIRNYNGRIYKCVSAHTSQESWTPDTAAALWTEMGDPSIEYPEWSQPIGAHDAYVRGSKVTYMGNKYVSNVDHNVWAPGTYGWDVVE